MNIKKKAYLYLGLLGVGLMLGSFGALISRNAGSTLAVGTTDCTTDADASCPSGYTKSGSGSSISCRKVISASSESNCEQAKGIWVSAGGTCYKYGDVTCDKNRKNCYCDNGYDEVYKPGTTIITSCKKVISATSQTACTKASGTWVTEGTCYGYKSPNYSCSNGGTLNGTKCCVETSECTSDSECGSGKICQLNSCVTGCRSNLDCSGTKVCKNNSCVESGLDFSDCDDVSLADRDECYSCIKQNKKWSESERKCQSSVYTSCNDYSSSTTKERCNSCSANGT